MPEKISGKNDFYHYCVHNINNLIMEKISNVVKTIEELDHETIYKLTIETIKNDGRKWMVYICIHIPNFAGFSIMPNFICEFNLNDIKLEENDFSHLIGRNIIKKEHCQIDQHTKGIPKFSNAHMTKFSLFLDNGDILNAKIAEVYDKRINNYYEHTGGDLFIDQFSQ